MVDYIFGNSVKVDHAKIWQEKHWPSAFTLHCLLASAEAFAWSVHVFAASGCRSQCAGLSRLKSTRSGVSATRMLQHRCQILCDVIWFALDGSAHPGCHLVCPGWFLRHYGSSAGSCKAKVAQPASHIHTSTCTRKSGGAHKLQRMLQFECSLIQKALRPE